MIKSQLNFIIDVLMLVLMMLAAGVGLLIKYVLLPGFARNLKYGRDVDLFFWGLDRHQWGSVHLSISLILLGLVILHWRQIKNIYRGLVTTAQQRVVLATGLFVTCLIFSLWPLFITPSVRASHGHIRGQSAGAAFSEQRGQTNRTVEQKKDEHHHSSLSETIPIYGYMTIADVAREYDVSEHGLARHIGVPVSQTGGKLGQLRRQYGFQMSAVRAYIEKNRTAQ